MKLVFNGEGSKVFPQPQFKFSSCGTEKFIEKLFGIQFVFCIFGFVPLSVS